jgi:hypothetical protein
MKHMTTRFRRWTGITLLSVLCLGSVVHFLHHVVDRDCDADGKHGSIPCTACSALHAGAVAPRAEFAAPRIPSVIARLALADLDEPAIREVVEGTPRAPPTS